MKKVSLVWFPIAAVIIASTLISCGSSNGGGGGGGAPGTANLQLDPSFGNGGTVTTSITSSDESAYAVAIQSDGKLVAAGNATNGIQTTFVLMRYNTDGSLDTTFNTTGIVTTAIGTNDDEAFGLAIQPDGKLVAAGYSIGNTQTKFAVVRYNTDGSLDTTFNTTGIVTTAIGTIDDKAFGLAIQPDGKLVAAGYTDDGTQKKFALVRYNTNGSMDAGFGSGGIITTAIGAVEDEINALVIQSDGKLLAAGYSHGSTQFEFALVRYNTDGSLDATFNTTGIATTAVGNTNDRAFALAIQSDGKSVASGFTDTGSQIEFALVRYNTDGSLDTTFNTTGIVTTAISTKDQAFGLVIQSDGKLVAAGFSNNGNSTSNGPRTKLGVVRYNTDGSLDATFGTGGKVTTAFGTIDDGAFALAIQSDGKLVAAGYYDDGSHFDLALARYLP